ncbi:hypothetical protein AeNC1_007998 [Aphanomyces euteiches]|nr:hypothetical protein AeNC1_007998 [Aphanomyces euteiches]
MGLCTSIEAIPVQPPRPVVPQRPQRPERPQRETKHHQSHVTQQHDPSIDWSRFRALVPLRQEFFIRPQDIEFVRRLPSAMNITCLVHVHGEAVVLKAVPQDGRDTRAAMQSLVAEIKNMSRIHHPNIVDFRGFTFMKSLGLCAAFESMQTKSLWDVLSHPKLTARLSWPKQKIQYAIDVCRALDYMHSLRPKLIHRNVKASKVRLNHGFRVAKLSGFDLARDQTFEKTMTKAGLGDIQWSAPELLIDGDYSELVDIYAFGVLLVELDTCEVPLKAAIRRMSDVELHTALKTGRLRPAPSSSCPPEVAKVIKHCLQFDPRNRPSSSRLLRMLLAIQTNLNR